MEDVFEKFSNNYKKSLKTAADLALELNHNQITPDHILYGLISQRGSVGAELFTSMEVKIEDIKNNIAKLHQIENSLNIPPRFSEEAKTIIQKSIYIAHINGHKYVGTEHLIASLIQINDEDIKKIFKNLKISESDLTQQVVSVLKSASKLPDITETFRVDSQANHNIQPGIAPAQASVLEVFGNNLTSPQIQDQIDPVIGREDEINRIIQILSRRKKNNPIILGDPGVGKTAIVEGLAKKIFNGEVPEILKNKKIYTLDLSSIVAGTMYRGEFENRLKQIIDEVRKRPEIILFIDEIHNIIGAGSASGSMDAANILKPALARGEFRCIGATTFDDYRKSIENDPALDRRFQPIKIKEPTAEQAKEILLGISKYFENFHQVRINEDAIDSAIAMSQRYMQDKFLPDKAIDLIDEASAVYKVERKPSSREIKIQKQEKKLAELLKRKDDAVLSEDFSLALKIKEEIIETKNNLEELRAKNSSGKNKIIGEITEADITRIITKITGIPVENLITSEKRQILKLDKKLKEKIIGQDPAVDTIADFIKRAKAGLTPEYKPLASFMFMGPSGVGKTHTAKILSRTLFNDENSLIKIDMSEYSEKFNISKLIGAPAGYVGYKESGQLTERVKHKPYSIVLFDEIEKANPEVFDLLLQILDDGYLTDATGTKINFRNTIIIMTSNIGSRHIGDGACIGFDNDISTNPSQVLEEKIINDAKDYFKIEFLNRLDKIIYFNTLSLVDLQKIVKLELEILRQRANKQKIYLNFNSEITKLIAQKSQSAEQGARSIQKTIQELIEAPLSSQILEDKISSGSSVDISIRQSPQKGSHLENNIIFKVSNTETEQ